MEMKRCERGHYYDASMHVACPYCNNVRNTEMTVAMGVSVIVVVFQVVQIIMVVIPKKPLQWE